MTEKAGVGNDNWGMGVAASDYDYTDLDGNPVAIEVVGLDDLGMVTAGRSASFVVLDADPLADINNTRRISDVYLQGLQVDRDTLRAGFQTGAP